MVADASLLSTRHTMYKKSSGLSILSKWISFGMSSRKILEYHVSQLTLNNMEPV